jgi:uncharacterized membrane protein
MSEIIFLLISVAGVIFIVAVLMIYSEQEKVILFDEQKVDKIILDRYTTGQISKEEYERLRKRPEKKSFFFTFQGRH